MTRLWIHHDAVFLFVSNHKFEKLASCPPPWNKRHQYAHAVWWEIFAPLPQASIRIRSSRAGYSRFQVTGKIEGFCGGLKFSISGFYWVGKIGKHFFGWLDLRRKVQTKDYYKAHHNVYCLKFFYNNVWAGHTSLLHVYRLQYINCMSEWEWLDWERVVQKQ